MTNAAGTKYQCYVSYLQLSTKEIIECFKDWADIKLERQRLVEFLAEFLMRVTYKTTKKNV